MHEIDYTTHMVNARLNGKEVRTVSGENHIPCISNMQICGALSYQVVGIKKFPP